MIRDQVKRICEAYDLKPQKNKGQNFLISEKVLNQIVEAADLSGDDVVLEVGPGLGILTEALVKKTKKVIGVELDSKLLSFLRAKFAGVKNLELINSDILKFLPADDFNQPYKIVANISYNITSHFLKKFLTIKTRPSSMVLLIQKEVAQRVCAKPGEMSLLSVSVQVYGRPQIVSFVSSSNFWPAPEVDSAILKIADILPPNRLKDFFGEISEKQFFQLVRIGFSSKRKKLTNNLAAGLKISADEARLALAEVDLDSKIRPQNLSTGDWLKLAKILKIYLN